MKLILALLSALFLFGCSATVPQIQVTPQTTNHEIPPQLQTVDTMAISTTFYKTEAGTNVYIWDVGNKYDVINCGDSAHGPEAAEWIKRKLNQNLPIHLIITNTSEPVIGGCAEFIKDLTQIQKVEVYSDYLDTDSYRQITYWTPLAKMQLHPNETYAPVFNGFKIDFERISSEKVKTNGTEYRNV